MAKPAAQTDPLPATSPKSPYCMATKVDAANKLEAIVRWESNEFIEDCELKNRPDVSVGLVLAGC